MSGSRVLRRWGFLWLAFGGVVSAVGACGADGPGPAEPFGMTGSAPPVSSGSGGVEDDDANAESMDDDAPDESSSGRPVGESGDTGGGTSASATDSDDGDGLPDGPFGACAEVPPAGAPTAPAPPAYGGGVCPPITPGYVAGFTSGGASRSFAFAVPSNYDETKQYPLVFGWYHLTGNAQDFLDEIGAQALADETQTIYAIPEATGSFQFVWPSTPLDNGSAGTDLTMFDDMLACISEQYNINPNCVGSAGVSAGGLWTSYLAQQRGQYLSSNVVISGGHPGDVGWWGWSSSGHKFASLVLWGGPSDELVISFHAASLNLLSEYRSDNHFAIECEHTGGHGAPPPDNPGDDPPFEILFDFFLAHPYWLDDGSSPYQAGGLPDNFPSYCAL